VWDRANRLSIYPVAAQRSDTSSVSFASALRRQGHPCVVMDGYGDDNNDNNNNADTSGRSSSGDSNASDINRELVDFYAFILGLVGNGAADDAKSESTGQPCGREYASGTRPFDPRHGREESRDAAAGEHCRGSFETQTEMRDVLSP
jgi:hypothetical protein